MTSISRLVRNQFCAYAPKLKLGKDIIDPRRRPVVPIQHIISLLFCVPLAQKLSMLQIDQWARSERARSFVRQRKAYRFRQHDPTDVAKNTACSNSARPAKSVAVDREAKTVDHPVAGRTIAQARRDRRIACGRPVAYGSCAHWSKDLLSGRLSVNGGTRA